jgi:uncharacterized membrane protein YfcA
LIGAALLGGVFYADVGNLIPVADYRVGAIVFLSATMSSIAGFAFSAFAGPLLLHVAHDKLYAIQILLVASIALQMVSVWQLRRGIEVRGLLPYLAGGMATIPLGIYLLVHTPTTIYIAALGAFLIAYAAFVLVRPGIQLRRNGLLGQVMVGALGGVTGATAAFPGAFVTIWCGAQGWDKQRQRAVYQPFILGMQILTLLALAAVQPHRDLKAEVLLYSLPAVLGAYIGLNIFGRLSTAQFNRVVGCYLLLSGVVLASKAVLG